MMSSICRLGRSVRWLAAERFRWAAAFGRRGFRLRETFRAADDSPMMGTSISPLDIELAGKPTARCRGAAAVTVSPLHDYVAIRIT